MNAPNTVPQNSTLLTDMEKKILMMVAYDYDKDEITRQLGITQVDIPELRSKIFQKLSIC